MKYSGIFLDFGGVVAIMRHRLLGEAGHSPFVADVNADVIEAVQQLRSRGTACVLVSNNDRAGFAQHFGDVPVDDWFDHVLFSSDVNSEKPRPPIYLEALRLTQLEAEVCVFLDDLPQNVDTALRMGMSGVVIDSPPAAAAYLRELLDE